jgi:FtsZ-interacting cell division protein ZipA
MNTTMLIILIAVIVIAAVGLWAFMQKRRTTTLRSRFGPEYERAVHEYGNRSKAETALERRTERTEKYHIRSLTPEEQQRSAEEWHKTQARFVDDPPLAIREADHLVAEVMRMRGYPMSDFDHRAEDLSVDHPHVVRNYRAARDIAEAQREGRASTEDLRQAMVYYRELFDDLLETHPAGRRV